MKETQGKREFQNASILRKVESPNYSDRKVKEAVERTRQFFLADPYSVFEESEGKPPARAFRWILYTGPKFKAREWLFKAIYRGQKTHDGKKFFDSAPKYATARFLIIDFAKDEQRVHQVGEDLEQAASQIEKVWQIKPSGLIPAFITPEGLVGISVSRFGVEVVAVAGRFERRTLLKKERFPKVTFPHDISYLKDQISPKLMHFVTVAHELTHIYLDGYFRQMGKETIDSEWVFAEFFEGVAEATAYELSGAGAQKNFAWFLIADNRFVHLSQFLEKDGEFPIPGDPRLHPIRKVKDLLHFYMYHLVGSLSHHLVAKHGTDKFLEFLLKIYKAKKLSQVEKQLSSTFGYENSRELSQEWFSEGLRSGFAELLEPNLTTDEVKEILLEKRNEVKQSIEEMIEGLRVNPEEQDRYSNT